MSSTNKMRLDDECINNYLSEDYFTFLINYDGDIYKELSIVPYACAIQLGYNTYAILVKTGNLLDFYDKFSTVLNIEASYPYTLTELQPAEAANILRFHDNNYLGLQGEGTVAIIIDTGIDYLNPQFWNEDNTTRIKLIWDQSIQSNQEPNQITYYGTVYSREEINKAIAAHLNGSDPYAIVPSKDENGHGTNMAGLVGARGLDGIIGGAPKCEFIIVKLKEAKTINLNLIGIFNRPNIPIYEGMDIFNAIRFVDQYQYQNNLPIAVLLSMNTNWTSHEGSSILERSINYISSRNGIIFVTNTGNQGASSTHASGYFKKVGEIQNIEVNIAEGEKNFSVIVWVPLPNLLTAAVVSPTGEVAEPSEAISRPGQYEQVNLVLENSKILFSYSITNATNGNQVIYIYIENPKAGVWQFRLKAAYIVDGIYNMWLPQRPLILPETRFINADPYTTIQAPSMAKKAITTSFYNQSNNTININSGRGYSVNDIIKPDLTTGGEKALTTGLNNKIVTVSGGSVAGAVLCGAVLLLLEWGIVDGNDPTMYSTSIISYLTRGTSKRPGDIYPNPQWGYGMLNLQGTFENLRYSSFRNKTMDTLNILPEHFFINIPNNINMLLNSIAREVNYE